MAVLVLVPEISTGTAKEQRTVRAVTTDTTTTNAPGVAGASTAATTLAVHATVAMTMTVTVGMGVAMAVGVGVVSTGACKTSPCLLHHRNSTTLKGRALTQAHC